MDIEKKLPNEKFFAYADEQNTTLVRVSYCRLGGAKDLFLVHDADELRQLINKLPPQARVELCCAHGVFEAEERAYLPDSNGNLNPGAY